MNIFTRGSVDDEMTLFRRYLDDELTLEQWAELANSLYPPPRERITFVPDSGGWMRVVWVRQQDDGVTTDAGNVSKAA